MRLGCIRFSARKALIKHPNALKYLHLYRNTRAKNCHPAGHEIETPVLVLLELLLIPQIRLISLSLDICLLFFFFYPSSTDKAMSAIAQTLFLINYNNAWAHFLYLDIVIIMIIIFITNSSSVTAVR